MVFILNNVCTVKIGVILHDKNSAKNNIRKYGTNWCKLLCISICCTSKADQTQKILLLNSYDNTFLENTRYHNDQ